MKLGWISGLVGAGVLTLLLVSAPEAHAKAWKNAYVSFELPDTWDCILEQTEWVCRSGDKKESREAIIILTAKEVGPMDSYEAYINHLNTPQQVAYRTAGSTTSRIIYPPKRVNINSHQWIDGLHLGSEVPSYFTRYLATVKDKIAILVTFSAHRDHYAKYSTAFFRSVQTLRVIATSNLLANPNTGPLGPSGTGILGSGGVGGMPADMMDGMDDGGDAAANAGAGGSNLKKLLMGLAVVLAAGGAYIFLKGRKS